MRHRRFSHPFRRALRVGALVTVAAHPAARTARAQLPPAAQSAPGAVPAYRAPTIALVQPVGTATVPQDMPVVVFRYVQGEPDDAVDLQSLRIVVDGEDQSELFRVQDDKVWGPMTKEGSLSAGPHSVTARLCSTRRVCATLTTTVTVEPTAVPKPTSANAARRDRLIDLLLTAARKLLEP